MRRAIEGSLTLLVGLLLGGCLMPSGAPVFVERRTGDYWSGEGVLLERSADEEHCRVAVRDTALVVQKKWVRCRYVHSRRPRG